VEWNRISPNSWLLFTRAEIIQLKKDPATRAKASPSLLKALGYPSDAEMYFGWIDAFHQTHCLNILRRHSYWDYYYSGNYGTWDHAHELHWTHVSHCLDIIRQSLQCNANADIITHVWKEGQDGPYPDFNIERKCSNFEGLRDWQERAMVPDELVAEYVVRPADEDIETLYPAEPELFLSKGVEPAQGRVFDHEVEEPKHWYSSW
jgi:Mycotoxin biosynthesis protein UstYa